MEWVSFSCGDAMSKLPYMKAIIRLNGIVHWQLRPVVDCMVTNRPGWLMQKGVLRGVGGHRDEFGLSARYPWFIESRRALQIQQRKHEADGGSTLASSDPFSEQLSCASSEGLLGLLLGWEKMRLTFLLNIKLIERILWAITFLQFLSYILMQSFLCLLWI